MPSIAGIAGTVIVPRSIGVHTDVLQTCFADQDLEIWRYREESSDCTAAEYPNCGLGSSLLALPTGRAVMVAMSTLCGERRSSCVTSIPVSVSPHGPPGEENIKGRR